MFVAYLTLQSVTQTSQCDEVLRYYENILL